ncbi:MAG: hypothetical protein K2X90_03075 [Candidatus Babeliaceae bacterium]|nr:hypothetical protein [Candidatus Babeliaceae bacterium]
MTIKKLFICIFLSSCINFYFFAKTEVSSGDVSRAHDLQRQLHAAHHEKLCIVSDADPKGHFKKIIECHEKIRAIETNGATKLLKTLNPDDCTTSKCLIMRLIHQISFNIQALMKSLKPEDIAKIKEINQQIFKLKVLLKKYGIDDNIFEKHPISVYL